MCKIRIKGEEYEDLGPLKITKPLPWLIMLNCICQP